MNTLTNRTIYCVRTVNFTDALYYETIDDALGFVRDQIDMGYRCTISKEYCIPATFDRLIATMQPATPPAPVRTEDGDNGGLHMTHTSQPRPEDHGPARITIINGLPVPDTTAAERQSRFDDYAAPVASAAEHTTTDGRDLERVGVTIVEQKGLQCPECDGTGRVLCLNNRVRNCSKCHGKGVLPVASAAAPRRFGGLIDAKGSAIICVVPDCHRQADRRIDAGPVCKFHGEYQPPATASAAGGPTKGVAIATLERSQRTLIAAVKKGEVTTHKGSSREFALRELEAIGLVYQGHRSHWYLTERGIAEYEAYARR